MYLFLYTLGIRKLMQNAINQLKQQTIKINVIKFKSILKTN